MELREKIAQQIFAICQEVFAHEEFAEGAAGRILAIPEIAEALAVNKALRTPGSLTIESGPPILQPK